MGIYKRSDISPIQIKMKPTKGQPGEPGEPGEGEGEGEPQDGQGKPGKGKPGEGKPGEGEGEGEPGEGGNQPGSEKSAIDKAIEDKLAKRKDASSEDLTKQQAAKKSQEPPKPVKTGNAGDLYNDKTVYKPAFSWKDLIRQFVASQAPPETTYTRPSSRSATQVDIARQTGAAAIKPGERPGEDIFKLLMVFDTSGSMMGTIGPALAETRNLLSKMAPNLDAAIGITFFASQPIFFAADLKNNTAWTVPSFNDMKKPVPKTAKKPLNIVLQSSMSGGTDFSAGLAAEISGMASKGYNIIMFSDEDMLYGDNWTNLVNLYKSHKQKFFFIADSSASYNAIVKKLGVQPRTFGHL
jgi:hypothetical protein